MAELSSVPGALPWAHPTDLRTMVNLFPAGILVVDGQGTVLFVNPALEGMLGVPGGELAGRSLAVSFEGGEVSLARQDGAPVVARARRLELMWEGNYAEAYFLEENDDRGEELERLEKHLVDHERRLGEARFQVQSAEERAIQAEEQLTESQNRALCAQNATAQAEVRSTELSGRLEDALKRLEQASQMLAQAEQRAREAEGQSDQSAALLVRLEASETVSGDAAARVAELEQELADALDRARQAEARSERAEKELRYAGGWSPWGYEPPPEIDGEDDGMSHEGAAVASELLEEARRRAEEAEARAAEAERRARDAEEKAGESEEGGPAAELLEEAEKLARAAEAKARTIEMQAIEAEQRSMEASRLAEDLDEQLRLAEERARQAEEEARRQELRARQAEHKVRLVEEQAAAEAQGKDSQEAQEWIEQARASVQEADERVAAAEEVARLAEERARLLEQKLQASVAEAKKHSDQLQEAQQSAGTTDLETQRLAFEDQLTRLPNVNILRQYLAVTSERVSRGEGVAALLLLDLDRFRVVNDTLGHKAGDELLVEVASRMQALVGDEAVLGRKGEDEFLAVVYIQGGDQEQAVARARGLAHRIMSSLAEPVAVQGETVHISASIGISFYPGDAESSRELFEHADSAMYRAKELGRGRFQFYTSELHTAQKRRLTLESQLRVALEKEQFVLLYQPIVDLKTGRMAGVEAFLRWEHPKDGLTETGAFLDVAEESGLIVPIGDWVIREACMQARAMTKKFVSVNLSPRQLMQAGFVRRFMKWVEKAGIRARDVVVEIAEGFSSVDPERMDTVLTELAHWGVGLGIDDFGTGASSLGQIKRVGARFLKIDHTLVGSLPNDRQAASICLAVVGLTRSLGLNSLAEGVETEEQRIYMKQYGCQLAQGNHFSPPLPGRDVVQLLKHRWKV